MDFLNKIWDAIPDSMKTVVSHVLMVGIYTFAFVFLQAYTQNWQASVALTAGFRAALIAIAQVLEKPAEAKTDAKAGLPVEMKPKKLARYIP